MDAVKFIEERNRMCDSYLSSCYDCPLRTDHCIGFRGLDAERVVGVVEKWSAAHPRKTRQSVFLEQYPNARVDVNTGVLRTYPCDIEYGMEDTNYCNSISCADCRREFWMQEVE